jgi:hypothetical protein
MPGRRRILIAGGGAAGFFGAIACAEADPEAEVAIHEATAHPLAKVRVSGGGRCNVTHACFDAMELARGYPRGSRELIGPVPPLRAHRDRRMVPGPRRRAQGRGRRQDVPRHRRLRDRRGLPHARRPAGRRPHSDLTPQADCREPRRGRRRPFSALSSRRRKRSRPTASSSRPAAARAGGARDRRLARPLASRPRCPRSSRSTSTIRALRASRASRPRRRRRVPGTRLQGGGPCL